MSNPDLPAQAPQKSEDTAVAASPQGSNTSLGTRGMLVFIALSCSVFLSALDLGAVGTAAPTIVHDLQGHDFSWVAAAYNLSSAACLPLSGNLAQIFGRKYVLLTSLSIFCTGSAVTAAAPSMPVLIVGRAIQGVGGGGIQTLTYIVTADIIPLRKRGVYNSITGMTWTLGTVVGPFIAGVFAEKVSWRWLFYINLPLCALAIVIVYLFVNVKMPEGNLFAKLRKVDWIGNALIITSTTSCLLGLTWGGVRLPWSSYQVLLPLCLGSVGLVASIFYEKYFPSEPTLPHVLFSNPTTLCGLICTSLHGFVAISITFYLPTWVQAVRSASPIESGVLFLPMMLVISPAAIVEGILVAKIGRYKWLVISGWSCALLGIGLLTLMGVTTPVGLLVLFQLLTGIPFGLLFAATFAVLAPLPESLNAAALSLLTFTRMFSQAWGVAVTGAIVQNGLKRHLPKTVLGQFPETVDLAYSIIPSISSMDSNSQLLVKNAFVKALELAWLVMLGVSGFALLTAFAMKDIPLREKTDGKWGLEEKSYEPQSQA